MKERLTKEELIKKWGAVLTPSLSGNCKVIMIEPFHTCEQEYLCEFVDDNKKLKNI